MRVVSHQHLTGNCRGPQNAILQYSAARRSRNHRTAVSKGPAAACDQQKEGRENSSGSVAIEPLRLGFATAAVRELARPVTILPDTDKLKICVTKRSEALP